MSLDFLRVVVVIAPPLSTFPIDMISAIFSFRVLPPASPAASPAFDRFSEMIRFGTVNELYFFFPKMFYWNFVEEMTGYTAVGLFIRSKLIWKRIGAISKFDAA